MINLPQRFSMIIKLFESKLSLKPNSHIQIACNNKFLIK